MASLWERGHRKKRARKKAGEACVDCLIRVMEWIMPAIRAGVCVCVLCVAMCAYVLTAIHFHLMPCFVCSHSDHQPSTESTQAVGQAESDATHLGPICSCSHTSLCIFIHSVTISLPLRAPKLLLLEVVEKVAANVMVRATPNVEKVCVFLTFRHVTHAQLLARLLLEPCRHISQAACTQTYTHTHIETGVRATRRAW